MLRVATVLSAREWEARLVAAARDSAAVKLVLRAYLPEEVTHRAASIDVIVAGAETPWVTPTRVAAWRRLGIRVVGVHTPGDRPAAERLKAGGADLILEEELDSEHLVREIRLLDPQSRKQSMPRGTVIVVTGVRGGPGRTEIATALAWAASGRGEAALVDADLYGPSIAVRLGIPPRPDLADCVDVTLDRGGDVAAAAQTIGRLRVVPGALRSTGIRPESIVDVVESLALVGTVVVDAGPWMDVSAVIGAADSVVFVVEASPIGIVRASRIVDAWDGAPPALVLNKVRRHRRHDMVLALRKWSGLEPKVVLPLRAAIRNASTSGSAPHRSLVRAVDQLAGATAGGSGAVEVLL
jgi:MinD-like ATPase involved in chromosome partitioning or flagellar assembly